MKKTFILILSIIGILISAYLAYAKLTSNELVCGINEGCSIVQNSKYSTLLGIPLGIWGMAYYFMLFAIYFIDSKEIKKEHIKSIWIVWGILFSIYLTALEAFVIHEYCFWCLGSFFTIIIIGVLHFTCIRNKKFVDKGGNTDNTSTQVE